MRKKLGNNSLFLFAAKEPDFAFETEVKSSQCIFFLIRQIFNKNCKILQRTFDHWEQNIKKYRLNQGVCISTAKHV